MVSTDVTTSLKSPSLRFHLSFSDKCEVWRRLTKLDVCVWKIPGDFLVFSCSSNTLIVCWRKTMPAKTNVCTQWGHLGVKISHSNPFSSNQRSYGGRMCEPGYSTVSVKLASSTVSNN